MQGCVNQRVSRLSIVIDLLFGNPSGNLGLLAKETGFRMYTYLGQVAIKPETVELAKWLMVK
jgi:hypothetical protein